MKKFIKYTLIILGILIAGLLIIGLVSAKKYDFTRTIWIKADKHTVWNQVAHWKNFNNWSPWYEIDTAMTQKIEGTDGEKGARYSWKSEKAGSGNMLNTEMVENEKFVYELRFEDWDGMSTCTMALADSAGGTKVSWGMKGEAGFLPRIFMFFAGGMEGAVGKDYDKGLGYLKKYCEAHPEAGGAEVFKMGDIATKEFPKTLFVQIKRSAKISEYEKNAGPWTQEMAGKLMAFVQENKLEMRGTLFTIYYKWDMKTDETEFSIAMPVAKEGAAGKDGVSYQTIPGSNCAVMDFWGDYKYTGKAHMAMGDWLKKENKMPTGATMEEYVTDPGVEKDPAKWQTRIWYPIGQSK